MFNDTGFAVHDFWRMFNGPAKSVSNALVSQTNSQEWNFWPEFQNSFMADTKIFWFFHCAWSRRNHNVSRIDFFNLFHCNMVIGENHWIAFEFSKILIKVVGERVVVVDDEGFQCVSRLGA